MTSDLASRLPEFLEDPSLMDDQPNIEVFLSARRSWNLSTNRDDDFDKWRECSKCHHPLRIPKALPCLHTICLHCLRIHYDVIKSQVQTQERLHPSKYNFFNWDGVFPCPICHYPCYILRDGLVSLPTNKRLIRLSYKERLMAMFEVDFFDWCIKQAQKQKSLLQEQMPKGPHEERSKTPQAAKTRATQGPKPKETQGAKSKTADHSRRSYENEGETSCKEAGAKQDAHVAEKPVVPKSQDGTGKESESLGATAEAGKPDLKSMDVVSLTKMLHQFKPPLILPAKLFKKKYIHLIDIAMEALRVHNVLQGDLQAHWNHVFRECRGKEEDLLYIEEDPNPPDHKDAKRIIRYSLNKGDGDLDVTHPNAIAVNPHTGHLVVVDTTWDKAVLYKTHTHPYGVKKFNHPIVDVCFCPPTDKDRSERFCAMGRRADRKGIMVYTATFNKNPTDFKCTYQRNVRDVSGILVIEPNVLFISLCYANTVIRQLNESQFVDLATRTQYGIYYPTHLTETAVGEIVVADTGNHRIGVFYGPNYLACDFYGEYGCAHGQFFYPMGLAADKDRRLYVCDTNNYRVQVLNRFFTFESCPIKRTYLMSKSIAQDVKPVDCAINEKQKLVVLFRGRGFMSLQVFQYFVPQSAILLEEQMGLPVSESTSESDCGWCCYLCCSRCCCGQRDRPNRRDYEPIQGDDNIPVCT